MGKLIFTIFLGIFLLAPAIFAEENYTEITNQTCDALTNCSGELECYNFPESGLRCAEENPCSYYECSDNKTCSVSESNPAQLTCSSSQEDNETEEENETEEPNSNATKKIHPLKQRLQDYLNSNECPDSCTCTGSVIKCETEGGRIMTIVAGKSGNIIIQTKGINASTTVVLIKNNTGIFGNFSGKFKKIKFLPDEIKEKVLKKLKIKNCTNCSIELKEDGSYEMNIEGKYRILGIFPRKVVSVTKIDSETGEIILVKRPWWRFLALKSKE